MTFEVGGVRRGPSHCRGRVTGLILRGSGLLLLGVLMVGSTLWCVVGILLFFFWCERGIYVVLFLI
jgi:hypothetical protein